MSYLANIITVLAEFTAIIGGGSASAWMCYQPKEPNVQNQYK